ncbi:MAG: proliferation-associated protein 2G4/curved DNA-binding protein Cdb4 [Amphiamblys sp. WSBS2006]|nr:MAG: proliferation-associated protein 2G4/curved DNA-binding protein Cdb4 [Amphiamblys sp. WSBS2006]
MEGDTLSFEAQQKYWAAGRVASAVMRHVLEKCRAGCCVLEICQEADWMVENGKTAFPDVFSEDPGTVSCGVSLPTTVSVNECVCNGRPAESGAVLREGDLASIELGVHVDGYPVVVGHSVIVGTSSEHTVQEKSVHVVSAARSGFYKALECVLVKGCSLTDITAEVRQTAAAWGCSNVDGVTCTEMFRYDVGGYEKGRTSLTEKNRHRFLFKPGGVYSVRVAFSSGEGKMQGETGKRAVLYQRTAAEKKGDFRVSKAKELFEQIEKEKGGFPFVIPRDEGVLLGISELCQKDILWKRIPFSDRKGERVCLFRTTVYIQPDGVVIRAVDDFCAPCSSGEGQHTEVGLE